MILQKTELFWHGDETTVYIDILYTEDAHESEMSYLDHLKDGGKGKITYGKFELLPDAYDYDI